MLASPPSNNPSSERLYDWNFVLAMASQTSFVIANTLMAHYARWIEFLGGNVRQVGWVMGIGAIVGLLLRPWMAQWINRFGPKTVWLGGYGVFAAGAIGNLLLSDLSLGIYALRSCGVLGSAIVFASSLTYISQIAPASRRTEAIGILGVGGFLGMLIGPVLGDVMLGADERLRLDFVRLFVAASIGSLLPAGLVLLLRNPPPARDASAPLRSRKNQAMRLSDFVSTVAHYWPGTILLIDFSFGIGLALPFVFLATHIDRMPLIIPGVSVFGLFFWCYGGWGLISRVWLRSVPDRLGRRKVLLCGTAFLACGLLSYLLVSAERPWLIIVPALLTGTAHSLMFHTMTALTIDGFPHELRGTGSALALMMMDAGMIAGAPLLAQIAANFGFEWMFATAATFTLAAGIAYAIRSIPIWRERREKRLDLSLATMTSTTSVAVDE